MNLCLFFLNIQHVVYSKGVLIGFLSLSVPQVAKCFPLLVGPSFVRTPQFVILTLCLLRHSNYLAATYSGKRSIASDIANVPQKLLPKRRLPNSLGFLHLLCNLLLMSHIGIPAGLAFRLILDGIITAGQIRPLFRIFLCLFLGLFKRSNGGSMLFKPLLLLAILHALQNGSQLRGILVMVLVPPVIVFFRSPLGIVFVCICESILYLRKARLILSQCSRQLIVCLFIQAVPVILQIVIDQLRTISKVRHCGISLFLTNGIPGTGPGNSIQFLLRSGQKSTGILKKLAYICRINLFDILTVALVLGLLNQTFKRALSLAGHIFHQRLKTGLAARMCALYSTFRHCSFPPIINQVSTGR